MDNHQGMLHSWLRDQEPVSSESIEALLLQGLLAGFAATKWSKDIRISLIAKYRSNTCTASYKEMAPTWYKVASFCSNKWA